MDVLNTKADHNSRETVVGIRDLYSPKIDKPKIPFPLRSIGTRVNTN